MFKAPLVRIFENIIWQMRATVCKMSLHKALRGRVRERRKRGACWTKQKGLAPVLIPMPSPSAAFSPSLHHSLLSALSFLPLSIYSLSLPCRLLFFPPPYTRGQEVCPWWRQEVKPGWSVAASSPQQAIHCMLLLEISCFLIHPSLWTFLCYFSIIIQMKDRWRCTQAVTPLFCLVSGFTTFVCTAAGFTIESTPPVQNSTFCSISSTAEQQIFSCFHSFTFTFSHFVFILVFTQHNTSI